jgi:hypothetical protein
MRFAAVSMALAMTAPAFAQTLFFADFEPTGSKSVPNADVNKAENWKPDNKDQQWAISDFPGNKTKALEQVPEGCGRSGNTPLPADITFTDGVIQMEMGWKDNDGWGIVFRQTAKNAGYLVVFGSTETPAVIIAGLDKCGETGKCMDGMGCENNPANTLAQVPITISPRDETGATSYLGRVQAVGDTIRVWFLKLSDVKDPFAADLGKPLAEVKDSRFKSGKVGVFHESNRGHIDNVLVAGPGGATAVEPTGRLATLWAGIKRI